MAALLTWGRTIGWMVGDGVREAELLRLLWKLMREREVLETSPFVDAERRSSALDQCDLQIVRTLAILALVRGDDPPAQ